MSMTLIQADSRLTEFLQIDHSQELMKFGKQLEDEGFTSVRRFLDDIRSYLRIYMDDKIVEASRILANVKQCIPAPARISPSWQGIWQEYDGIMRYKNELLQRFGPPERDGEWQVLLNNPFTNQQVAIYPGLTFQEAVYLYAYFRTGLENNEIIRLQRINTLVTHTGADH